MSRLAELAIASLDDPDAAVVLGDWVLENKWFDTRVMPIVNWSQYRRAADTKRRKALWALAAGGKRTRKPSRALAKAIAAVVLFGEWPDTAYEFRIGGSSNLYHWPVVARCWVNYGYSGLEAWLPRLNGMIDRDLDAQQRRIQLVSDPNVPRGTLFGINREVVPTRLAGQRLHDVWTANINAAMERLRRDLG